MRKFLLALVLFVVALLISGTTSVAETLDLNVPPVCQYGYYDHTPYACAPQGFYGPQWFYNGVFLGVGPWYLWGYTHGWVDHKFHNSPAGRYHGDGLGDYRGGYGVAMETTTVVIDGKNYVVITCAAPKPK